MAEDFDNDITPSVARALSRLGIDIHSAEQIADAYSAGRWILAQHTQALKHELEREAERIAKRSRRGLWTMALTLLILTPIATLLVNYISRRFF